MERKHCKAEQICYAIIVHLPKGNVPLVLQLTIAKALTSISKQHCVNNNLGLDLNHKKEHIPLGVPETSRILMADSQKLSFPTLIMKLILIF